MHDFWGVVPVTQAEFDWFRLLAEEVQRLL
jgi:hypothetical protein